MVNPSPCSVSAAGAGGGLLDGVPGDVEQHAELVAAHPVGRSGAGDVRPELGPEALQQSIAGRVAVGVVVVLEPVEVEERQHGAPSWPGVGHAVEIAREGAAVAQAGERVGQRLLAAGHQHPGVLAQRQHEAGQDGEQRGGGQDDGERVQRAQRGEDEDAQAERGEGDREGGEAHRAAILDRDRAAHRLPGGGREQHQARGPAPVEGARVDVGLVGDGDQVVGVGHPEEHDAQAEHGPGAIGAPATQGERGDDHGQQDEVAHRVGEVGRDTERVAADGVQHGLQDDRGAHGARGERGGQPVDPQRPWGALDARAQQQAQPGEDERVEGQVAGVGDRRDGDDRVVGQHQRPVHVAARPQQRAHADEPPGEALAPADRARAPQRQQRRADDHDPIGELAEGGAVHERAQWPDLRLA